MSDRITVAFGDATDFDVRQIFGLDGVDRAFCSYTRSEDSPIRSRSLVLLSVLTTVSVRYDSRFFSEASSALILTSAAPVLWVFRNASSSLLISAFSAVSENFAALGTVVVSGSALISLRPRLTKPSMPLNQA